MEMPEVGVSEVPFPEDSEWVLRPKALAFLSFFGCFCLGSSPSDFLFFFLPLGIISGGQSGRSSYLKLVVSSPSCCIEKMYKARAYGESSLVQRGYPSIVILFFRTSTGDRKSTRLNSSHTDIT